MAGDTGRDRYRRAARRAPFRDPRRRILIVCEGEKTEPDYFEQFAEFHKNSLVKVELAKAQGVPLSIVRTARDLKIKAIADAKREEDDNLMFEAVWCAFDVDVHPNIPEAKLLAGEYDIELAISNPCFELWLLLHLRDSPGMLHHHDVQALLKSHVPNYDKKVDFEVYRDGYNKAVSRAKSLDSLAASINEPGRNPTTCVYMLTETIIPPRPKNELVTIRGYYQQLWVSPEESPSGGA
jgi:RloB-like protein